MLQQQMFEVKRLTDTRRMIVVATACLTIFHPGHFFKPMMEYKQSKKALKSAGIEGATSSEK